MDQAIHIMKMCCYVFHYSRLDVLYVHVGSKIMGSLPVQLAQSRRKTYGLCPKRKEEGEILILIHYMGSYRTCRS
jgi:hypothetical protein